MVPYVRTAALRFPRFTTAKPNTGNAERDTQTSKPGLESVMKWKESEFGYMTPCKSMSHDNLQLQVGDIKYEVPRKEAMKLLGAKLDSVGDSLTMVQALVTAARGKFMERGEFWRCSAVPLAKRF